ncbi:MAG: T9SS type A sorting domain-containing protein [Bacteroidota bacterium]|nr:T9SS type A sorting domain-containing protein [Bacteroidota bacterium]
MRAGWNNLITLGQPVSCGYFFDSDHGLIGTGSPILRNPNSIPRIYTTSDGGKTWQLAVVPNLTSGTVTSIYMKDANIGYASLICGNNNFNLWKTTNGGAQWIDHTTQFLGRGTCAYATSKALIETVWDINYTNSGGTSVDDGKSFRQYFSDAENVWSNGIDFADDQTGVVTMGPSVSAANSINSWYTTDGGVSWMSGGPLPEAWSVYALKGTQTFFAMPEGRSTAATSTSLYRSTNGGRTWNVLYVFSDPRQPRFTGHIAGKANTLYVQTEGISGLGLYRSDNLGQSWKNVGGPTHSRDTRFVVTGCQGEVVYAFDGNGGVWKTIDGGDGTLGGLSAGSLLSLGLDTLTLSSTCIPARGNIELKNLNCTDYSLDSISFSPDPYHEFSLDTAVGSYNILLDQDVVLPIKFQTDSTVTRRTTVHVHGHYNGVSFDTTIVILASHISLITPLIALSADTVSISGDCFSAARGNIEIYNRNCDPLIIDTIIITPDNYGEFSIDTSLSGLAISSNVSVGIPALFKSDSDVTREVTVRIRAHSNGQSIDTTLMLRAEHSSVSGPILSLPIDSVFMEGRYCQPARTYIELANANCADLVIDSLIMIPPFAELRIDTTFAPNLVLAKFSSGGIPIYFQTDSNLTRQTMIRIYGHSYSRTIDTTIILVAKHSNAPEPFLVPPPRTRVGDSVLIPIFLRPTTDNFAINEYVFHLSYDGDVLSPSVDKYETKGTLSRRSTVTIGSAEPNGIFATVKLSDPITEDSDLTQPLIYVRMAVALSRNFFSPITLDTFSISTLSPLPLCTESVSEFDVDPQCGDSILSRFIAEGTVPGFTTIHPNPSSGGTVAAGVTLPNACTLTIELIDAMGRSSQTLFVGRQFQRGKHEVNFDTSTLPSGKYLLRMTTPDGNSAQKEIVVLH